MPGCVLRISGENLDLEDALAAVSFQPYRAYSKGQPRSRRPGQLHTESGFCVRAASGDPAPDEDMPRQIAEAEAFLTRHASELQRFQGVATATLDFGCFCRIGTVRDGQEIVTHFERFPASLLKLCGDLDIALEISLYPSAQSAPLATGDVV